VVGPLSVVCHIRAFCLNRSADLDANLQPQLGKERFEGSNRQAEHATANCSQIVTVSLANTNERFRRLPNYFGARFGTHCTTTVETTFLSSASKFLAYLT